MSEQTKTGNKGGRQVREPVRVLYLLDHTRSCFANRQLVRLVAQFRRMQVKAALISIENYGDLAEKFQAQNVPVVTLEAPQGKARRLTARLAAHLALRQLVQHNEPEILHVVGEEARQMGALVASSIAGVSVVSESWPGSRRDVASRLLDGVTAMLAPRPCTLFRDGDELELARERFSRIDPCEIVGHGVDHSAAQCAPLLDFEALSPGSFDIGAFVTAEACEAAREILQAFRIFRAHHPPARLILFGDGPAPGLEPWLTDLELKDAVLYRPLPTEPAALLGRLNILWAHGHPRPDQSMALQAMAIGLPVVIDHVTGLAPGIRSVGGAIMRDGAWPQQFAEATRELMHDEALMKRVGEAGRILVREQHSVLQRAERVRSLYARLVHGADV